MKFQDGNDSYRPHTEQNLISEILFSDIRFCEVRGRGSEQLQQTSPGLSQDLSSLSPGLSQDLSSLSPGLSQKDRRIWLV